MANAKDEPLKKQKRERKKREIKTVPESVISKKQAELGEQMMQSLESRDIVFEKDTQYPIDTLADYFASYKREQNESYLKRSVGMSFTYANLLTMSRSKYVH